ncbi:hypothetical protein SAMN02799624_05256 [Paenibacillus sp. UNC496MF]|nr:hypothetical protein SAMN02799624_05256 [Paenibacillus sp. UNC496MF]
MAIATTWIRMDTTRVNHLKPFKINDCLFYTSSSNRYSNRLSFRILDTVQYFTRHKITPFYV